METKDIGKLVTALRNGERVEPLDAGEVFAIEQYLGPVFDALKEYKKGLDDERGRHAIGDRFEYRGVELVVVKKGSSTSWKPAFELAMQFVPDKHKSTVKETVAEEFTKDTKTTKPVVG